MLRLAVAEIPDVNGCSGFVLGNDRDEIIPIFYGLTVDRGDDVTGLESGGGGGQSSGSGADDHAGLKSVNTGDGAGRIGLEANANAAANVLMLRPDELVIDVDDGVRGHGE